MTLRRLQTFVGITLVAIAGCGYPQFTFDGDATTIEGDETSTPDASVVDADDGAVPDTNTEPDASIETIETIDVGGVGDVGDAAAPDTAMPDTKVVDLGVDTAMPDTKIVDVGVDTGPVSTGCVGVTATFCRDFDTVATVDEGWSYQDISATGSIAFEKSGVSLPNALLSEVKPAGSLVTANIGKTITAPTLDSIARLDLWMKLEVPVYPGGSCFLFKYERSGDGITFSMDDSGVYVDVIAATYSFFKLPYVVVPNKWFHVRMDAKLRVAGGAVTVWIDDMSTPLLAKAGISTLSTDSTARLLVLGVYAEGLTGNFRARYDDVKLNFPP